MNSTAAIDFRQAYRGKRVLVTGHTGFKGAWLSSWLIGLGAEVSGLSLAPETSPNLFEALGLGARMQSRIVDIREPAAVAAAIAELRPEIVLHLAAQPLVRRSYADPLATFATNVLGTAHVMQACLATDSVRAVVCVTTDKVYDNREWPWPYRETDRLGGLDPYSASKACAELVAHVYQRNLAAKQARPRIATARGGNVVGGGDWSEDRIVPDIVRALASGRPIALRNPKAVRPWQHVLELCEGYLELGARLAAGEDGIGEAGLGEARFDEAWNFGPRTSNEVEVARLVEATLRVWGRPEWPVTIGASPLHEAQLLRLDISKAVARLGWKPRLDIGQTLRWTAQWYQTFYAGGTDPWELTCRQIADFEALRAPAA